MPLLGSPLPVIPIALGFPSSATTVPTVRSGSQSRALIELFNGDGTPPTPDKFIPYSGGEISVS